MNTISVLFLLDGPVHKTVCNNKPTYTDTLSLLLDLIILYYLNPCGACENVSLAYTIFSQNSGFEWQLWKVHLNWIWNFHTTRVFTTQKTFFGSKLLLSQTLWRANHALSKQRLAPLTWCVRLHCPTLCWYTPLVTFYTMFSILWQ